MNLYFWFLNLIGATACTQPIEFKLEGTVPAQIEEPSSEEPNHRRLQRTIRLHSFRPRSNLGESGVNLQGEQDYSNGIVPFQASSTAVTLNADIPVLDQGQYGTCVTFATTAALEMVLSLPDAISQQCTLALTKALGTNYWNGAWQAAEIINPLKQHGVVPQGKCNNVPYGNPNQKITLKQYKSWIDLKLDVNQVEYKYFPSIKLKDVTSALDNQHYIVMGFGLLNNGSAISVQGFDVVVDGKSNVGGLWACVQPQNKTNFCAEYQAGHEIVVTGYDDAQELLQIRNSWGNKVGDQGDFYMTYDFFNAMVMNGTEVW